MCKEGEVVKLHHASGRQTCCWHNEGAREVATAPTAAAQGGGRGKLYRKSEGVGGGSDQSGDWRAIKHNNYINILLYILHYIRAGRH